LWRSGGARLAQHELHPYAIDSTDGRREWQHFLRACEKVLLPYLPEAEPGLFTSQHAAYLWLRTQGYVGDAARLLVDGLHAAVAAGVPLTRQHLDEVRLSQRAQDEFHRLSSPTPSRPSPETKSRRAG